MPETELGDSEPLVADAIDACSQLIRFDTTNLGEGNSRGESEAAAWVASQLRDCGYEPVTLEPQPGRASTVVRIPGEDRTLPGLLVHGHLDVVPADEREWSVDPFGGEIRDGHIWGRGALDMKGYDATMLAAVKAFARDGVQPPRDIVFAFVADEEDVGLLGAGHIVEHHPELLSGVTHAIGEAGGTLCVLPGGGHLFPVTAAERGTAWIQLTAHGTPGHGSRPLRYNAVTVLARTLARLSEIEWPLRLTPAVSALIEGLSERLGSEIELDGDALESQLGDAARLLQTVTHNTLSPTMLAAGYKANVIPSEASAVLDGRIVPGFEDEFLQTIDALLPPAVQRSFISHQGAIASDPRDPELARMQEALRAHDPDAFVLPCCSGGGTDAKWFSRLGIACYGFAPELPHDDSLVHGIDERISLQSLAFGARVLNDYLRRGPGEITAGEA
jgi:acetylornithine deacetylase/succinyl-diaminopimelate desuccinylase-like protein